MGKTYKSFDECRRDIEAKREIALKKATRRIEDGIKDIIYNDFVNWYYEWGPPTMYDRTMQLYKAIGVKVKFTRTKKGHHIEISFNIHDNYGPNALDHSPYTIVTTWKTSDGKTHTGTYVYGENRDSQKEKRIFENFLRDIHGFAGMGDYANDGDIADYVDHAYQRLKDWVSKNAKKVIMDEIRNALK